MDHNGFRLTGVHVAQCYKWYLVIVSVASLRYCPCETAWVSQKLILKLLRNLNARGRVYLLSTRYKSGCCGGWYVQFGVLQRLDGDGGGVKNDLRGNLGSGWYRRLTAGMLGVVVVLVT